VPRQKLIFPRIPIFVVKPLEKLFLIDVLIALVVVINIIILLATAPFGLTHTDVQPFATISESPNSKPCKMR
jgi:hypothetical protein